MTQDARAPIPMLDLSGEVHTLWDELQPAIERVLRSGQFVGGPEVAAFEAEAADELGAGHAVGLNSGTDALVIALEALGIGPGDEVITTPFSFFASSEAVLRRGATPVFGDIDPVTLNLDPDTVPPLLSDRTRAILPVHLFGLPADMNRIAEIADAHGLAVVEDAAQAFGARCTGAGGAKAGTLGTMGAFSFYPTKTLGAYGDAGLLTISDDELAATARRLRTHGSRPKAKYVHDMLGHNSRLDALQAAILRVKLPRVALATAARRRVAGWYHELLHDTDGVDLPPLHDDHVFHQFTVQLPEDRLEHVQGALDEAGIAHQRFYPVPLSSQPVMGTPQARPVADAASARVLSLPVHPGLTPEQVGRVAEVIRGAVQG